MRTDIVMMEQQTTDTGSVSPFTPCLEGFKQTVVDIPVSRNRLSVLKWYGGNVAGFCKETRYHLFVLLNFTGGLSSGKTDPTDCCFVSGPYWYLSSVRLLLRCPKSEETFLRQMFLACACTSLPCPASALHSGYGAPNGHNVLLLQCSREECK